MRFLYLTEMGHHYSTEEGNPNNVRSNLAVWQGIENKLKKAIVDLKALEQPAQVGAGGVYQVGALEFVGNVGVDGDGLPAGGADSGGDPFGAVGVDVVDGDAGPGFR